MAWRSGARLISALLLLVVSAGSFTLWAWRDWTTPGPLPEKRIIVLPRGSGAVDVARTLGAEGVLAHPSIFLLDAAVTGDVHRLKAGEYEFEAAITPEGVADLLASGKTVRHRLTIPEGLTSAEIVAIVNATPELEGNPEPVPTEGSLMPETYFFALGDKRSAMVERMERAFSRAVAELWTERGADLPFAKPEDAVILASIVEKETGRDEERPHVAGVYVNRMRLGMRLQADPTVIYAITHGKAPLDRPLGHDDLGIDSPYNTYAVKGLPPTPIANPGLAALKAVLHPLKMDDLYFVADGTGKHVFAKTLAEQNQHINDLRRAQSQAAAPANPQAAPAR
ncbi:MAG TPA: endolytic transglycosylase MltG [Stellaceae bacterium]|nr:endolytic transglycosylase MltG [Stellaceae bacterium]